MLCSGLDPWVWNVGRGRCSESKPWLLNVQTRSPRTEPLGNRGEVGNEIGALAAVLRGASTRGSIGERTGPRTRRGKGSGGLARALARGVTRYQTMRLIQNATTKENSQMSCEFPSHTTHAKLTYVTHIHNMTNWRDYESTLRECSGCLTQHSPLLPRA